MTTPRRIRRALAGGRDDRGAAMMIALMVILLAEVISIAIAGTVLVQVKPTQTDRKSIRTVSAAEAGFDAALNRIRAASSAGVGLRDKLPCGPLSGPVSANPGSLTYSVTIRYYNADPTNRDAAWLASGTNRIICSVGGPTVVPAYALLTSKGAGSDVPGTKAGAGNRTLSTVYTFKTTNVNTAGGLIHLFDQANTLCLAVRADRNPAGKDDKLQLATCDPTAPGQQWSYTPELHLQIVNTTLCLEAESKKNKHVTLQPCVSAEREQKWSFNDIGRFEGTSDGKDTNEWCFTSEDDPGRIGSEVLMQKECSDGYDLVHTFSPEAKVGAGAAGEAVGNLVNYRYFGRCLDVTNQNVNMTWLIGYPCKQRPNPAFLTWNQVFTFVPSTPATTPATGAYKTVAPAGNYCLQAGSAATPPTPGTRALVKPCNAGETHQTWTTPRGTGAYATSYTVSTRNGLCLSLVDGPGEADVYLRQWGMAVVETCDGSTRQKWNAPANLTSAGLDGTAERVGG